MMRRAGSASPEAINAARTRSLGFGDRLVGQADDVEGRQARRHLHLHVHGAGLDALEGNRRDALNHGAALNPLPVRVVEFRKPAGRLYT